MKTDNNRRHNDMRKDDGGGHTVAGGSHDEAAGDSGMTFLPAILPARLRRAAAAHRMLIAEVVRFGIVGATATAIQYVIYWLMLRWMSPGVAMVTGYVISFIFNFYASTMFTFRVATNVRHGAGFVFSHAINMTMQVLLLKLFIAAGMSAELAPVPMFCICIPVNFILVRFFLKR